MRLPREGLSLERGQHRLVVHLVERQLTLMEHLPYEARERVHVALGRIFVLVDGLVRQPSQWDHLVSMLGVFLLIRFFGHARQRDFDGQVASDQTVSSCYVLVDEAGVREMLQPFRRLVGQGEDLRDGQLGRPRCFRLVGGARGVVLARGDQELLQIAPIGVLEDHVVRLLLATQTDQFHHVLVIQLVEKIQVALELLEGGLVLGVDQTLHHNQALFVAVHLILGRVHLAEFAPAKRLQFFQIATGHGYLVVIRLGLLGLVAALTLGRVRTVALIVGRVAILLFLVGRRVHLAGAGLFQLGLFLLDLSVLQFFCAIMNTCDYLRRSETVSLSDRRR